MIGTNAKYIQYVQNTYVRRRLYRIGTNSRGNPEGILDCSLVGQVEGTGGTRVYNKVL